MDKKDITSLELSKKWNKASIGSGYFQMKDSNNPALSATSLGQYPFKRWYGYGTYLITPNLSFTGEASMNYADYAKNGDRFTNTPGGKDTMYFLQLKYGDQVFNKGGQSNFIFRYYSVGANAIGLDNTKTTDKYNGLVLIYNYAFSKNSLGEFDYKRINDVANSANNYHYYRLIYTTMF